MPLPQPVHEWAFGAAAGEGVRVAVIDSGIDSRHPLVGGVASSFLVVPAADEQGAYDVNADDTGDVVGHGTACAAIIRAMAPKVEITSVRVLGADLRGKGGVFAAGLRWCVAEGFDVINLSLSTASKDWYAVFHEIADAAFFQGSLLVSAVNNVPAESYPSQYASVVSVAACRTDNPFHLLYNAAPPVEFGARGVDVEVAWLNGGTATVTGNSFAAPHVAGMAALIRSAHPGLAPFQVKSVLHALAANAVLP